jgi:hypothetical protein
MGYFPGGEIDIMQVGNEDDPAIKTLNAELEEWWMENGKIVRLDYKGAANADTPDQSLKWGIRWLYHKAQGIKDNQRYWRDWKQAVFRYGPNTEEYTNNVWSIYKSGIDKNNKAAIRLWTIFFLLFLGTSYWTYNNQGREYYRYFDLGEEHICIGRYMLEIGILDGLRIKKAVIGPIDNQELSSDGIKKETISVDTIYDLDNDGSRDILISAKHFTDTDAMYFFRIGQKKLESIRVLGSTGIALTKDNQFYGEEIYFGPK